MAQTDDLKALRKIFRELAHVVGLGTMTWREELCRDYVADAREALEEAQQRLDAENYSGRALEGIEEAANYLRELLQVWPLRPSSSAEPAMGVNLAIGEDMHVEVTLEDAGEQEPVDLTPDPAPGVVIIDEASDFPPDVVERLSSAIWFTREARPDGSFVTRDENGDLVGCGTATRCAVQLHPMGVHQLEDALEKFGRGLEDRVRKIVRVELERALDG